MGQAILFTSGKGGVGKTTAVANIGLALATLGASVVMIDADVGLNNLDVALGLENKVVYDVLDILEGRVKIRQALVAGTFVKGLFLLPSSRSFGNDIVSKKRFKEITERVKNSFDYVLIDCPAGIEQGFERSAMAADRAIVIVMPTLSSMRDADKVIRLLGNYPITKTELIVNMTRGDIIATNDGISPESIEQIMKTALIGIIPQDDSLLINTNYGAPPNSNTPFGKSIYMIANNILHDKHRLYDYLKSYTGIIGGIRRVLKRRI